MTSAKSAGPFDGSNLEITAVVYDATTVWPDEVGHLTPWVIDHLDEVGQELGIQLEAQTVRREVRLGSFRADMVVQDDQGRTVVIENQFGPSDHDHLAKIVMYACEASADVVVWIVAGTGSRFAFGNPIRPEHQRTLARLNRTFHKGISFYGLSIELWSEPFRAPEQPLPVLPRLRVVVRPQRPDLDGQRRTSRGRTVDGLTRKLIARGPGSTVAGMTVQRDRCMARLLLDDDQIAWLSKRPHAAHAVRREPYCDLEACHLGPHAALGQQGDGVEWWVHWTLSASEILETTMNCPAEHDDVDELGDRDICLLYEGHPGGHSFKIRRD